MLCTWDRLKHSGGRITLHDTSFLTSVNNECTFLQDNSRVPGEKNKNTAKL